MAVAPGGRHVALPVLLRLLLLVSHVAAALDLALYPLAPPASALVPNAALGAAVAAHGGLVAAGAPAGSGGNGTVAVYDCRSVVAEAGCRSVATLTMPTGIRIVLPSPPPPFEFGAAVAVHNGLIVVGAPGASQSFVFACTFDACTYLDNPAPVDDFSYSYDRYGSAVGAADAFIAVGGWNHSDVGTGPTFGVAHAFPCTSAGCNDDRQEMLAGASRTRDRFGFAVAADPASTLVAIGAPSAGSFGTVSVFSCTSGSGCSAAPYLTLQGTVANGQFGVAVAMNSGLVAVGSVSGGVTVFVCIDGGASGPRCDLLAVLAPPSDGGFGLAVAVSDGDVVVVGAPNQNGDVGVVHQFACARASSRGSPSRDACPYLGFEEGVVAAGQFGSALATVPGTPDLVIGAPRAASSFGAAYYAAALNHPTTAPTVAPTTVPTAAPTNAPTNAPTTTPTATPPGGCQLETFTWRAQYYQDGSTLVSDILQFDAGRSAFAQNLTAYPYQVCTSNWIYWSGAYEAADAASIVMSYIRCTPGGTGCVACTPTRDDLVGVAWSADCRSLTLKPANDNGARVYFPV